MKSSSVEPSDEEKNKAKLKAENLKRAIKIVVYTEIGSHPWASAGKFSAKIAKQFDHLSGDQYKYAEIISHKLINAKQYGKMLSYFMSPSKDPVGKEIAKKLINDFLVNNQNYINDEDYTGKLDRCLMIAAKLGDIRLYDLVKAKGGRFVRDNNLVVDEHNCNVLHYACQSENSELVKKIAEEMRVAERDKKFTPPVDSEANGQFDPFRIRDDKSGTKSLTQINELRPIHYMSETLARGLDFQYGLPIDGSPGTFVSAYNLFRIENRVLAKRNLDWAMQKQGIFGEDVQETALKGKGFASVFVANYTDKIELATSSKTMIAGNLAAAGAITGVAILFAANTALNNRKRKKLAIAALGGYEFVALPSLPVSPELKGAMRPVKGDYATGIFRYANHNLKEALRIRDFKTIKSIISSDPVGFKKTTHAILQAVRQVSQMSSFDAGINKAISSPTFKLDLYTTLVDKIEYDAKTDLLSKDAIQMIGQVLDSLYRPENKADNALAKMLIENMKKKNPAAGRIRNAINEWSIKFDSQKAELDSVVPFKKAKYQNPPGNHELIEAFEKCDLYKIRHIIAHGEFNYTSKEVMHAIEHMFVLTANLPDKTDLIGDAQDKPFVEFVVEGLAKKAGPKEFLHVLSHLINTRGQIDTGKRIIASLIARYDRNPIHDNNNTATADRERLKICALLAAGLGEIASLQKALSVLQKAPHNLSTLEIMDEKGNNILHYATQSQNFEMIKYICQNTSMISDFNIANKEIKTHVSKEGMVRDIVGWGKHKLLSEKTLSKQERPFHKESGATEYLTNIKKAHHIFQIPNREGVTPFRLIKSGDTNTQMDAFLGGIVGFRKDANEGRQNERDRKENRAATIAQAGIILAMLAASCGAIIPGAIGAGTALGALIASKVGLGTILPGFTITGSVFEGATAVGLALGTEHGLMPAFGKLGKEVYKRWDKAFNGASMEALTDYDDRILTKSDQLTTILANKLAESDVTAFADIMRIIAKESEDFINAESDPAMKELARLAAVNASLRFTPPDNIDPSKILTLDELATQMKEMIYSAATLIEKKAPISNAKKSFEAKTSEFNEKLSKLEKDKVVYNRLKRINKKIDNRIDAIDRIKEDYVAIKDIKELAITKPDLSQNELFRVAAINKADADLKRQIKLINTSQASDVILQERASLTKNHADKTAFIKVIADAYESALTKRQENYVRAYNNKDATKMIREELRERLAKIEGGSLKKGPLTQAADKIFKNIDKHNYTDKSVLQAVIQDTFNEAYQNVKHPEPSKAIQMRQAIDLYFDRAEFVSQLQNRNLGNKAEKSESTAGHTESLAKVPLILSRNGSTSGSGNSEVIPDYQFDDTTKETAATIAIKYAVNALSAYHYDASARDALSNLGVVHTSRGMGGDSIEITPKWKHIFAQQSGSLPGIPVSLSALNKVVKIQIPEGWDRQRHDSKPDAIKKDTQGNKFSDIPSDATYSNKTNQAEFKVKLETNGYNFTTIKMPPVSSVNQTENLFLQFANDQLQLYIKLNGTNKAIDVGGSSLEIIKAVILICKVNNLKYNNTSGLVANTTPQEIAAVRAKYNTAEMTPLLARVDLSSMALPSNVQLSEIARKMHSGQGIGKEDLKKFGQEVQASQSPAPVPTSVRPRSGSAP